MATKKRAAGVVNRTSSTEAIGSVGSAGLGSAGSPADGSEPSKRPRARGTLVNGSVAGAVGALAVGGNGGGSGIAATHNGMGGGGFWFQEQSPSAATASAGSGCQVTVPRAIAEHLAADWSKKLLQETTGVVAHWSHGDKDVVLSGTPEQVAAGKKLLQRIMTHCNWGVTEAKIRSLLRPRQMEKVCVRLSPMSPSLKPVEKSLSAQSPMLTMGKDKPNDAVVSDELVSRQHCCLELDGAKGTVYVVDISTNGTFLNGKRLPQKKQGKIMVSHGDALLLKDPATNDSDFGYVINILDTSPGACGSDPDGPPDSASGNGADGARWSFGSSK